MLGRLHTAGEAREQAARLQLEGTMADDDRWERGAEMIKKVYAGDVVTAPKGAMAFSDVMLEQLFAEVWTGRRSRSAIDAC